MTRYQASVTENKYTVFWSWQADSDAWSNRYFIEDCLERAAKNVGKGEGIVIAVDRDTLGVGGNPAIVTTILEKIRAADVFVWDQTLVARRPKPAPNANVLIEYGYALAVLGEGRTIAVLNEAVGPGPEHLPFDLQGKRWPLRYKLAAPNWLTRRLLRARQLGRRTAARKKLVKELENALRDALNEPKRGAFRADPDVRAARTLWAHLSSPWMSDWFTRRSNMLEYEERETNTKFFGYLDLAQRPELAYLDPVLRGRHETLVHSLVQFLNISAIQMVPAQNSDLYVATMKDANNRGRWTEDSDQLRDDQLDVLTTIVNDVWEAWKAYAQALAIQHADVVHAPPEGST